MIRLANALALSVMPPCASASAEERPGGNPVDPAGAGVSFRHFVVRLLGQLTTHRPFRRVEWARP
jgi:hypothetical protein